MVQSCTPSLRPYQRAVWDSDRKVQALLAAVGATLVFVVVVLPTVLLLLLLLLLPYDARHSCCASPSALSTSLSLRSRRFATCSGEACGLSVER